MCRQETTSGENKDDVEHCENGHIVTKNTLACLFCDQPSGCRKCVAELVDDQPCTRDFVADLAERHPTRVPCTSCVEKRIEADGKWNTF